MEAVHGRGLWSGGVPRRQRDALDLKYWYNAGEYGGIPLVDDDGNGESATSRDQEGIVPVSCF